MNHGAIRVTAPNSSADPNEGALGKNTCTIYRYRNPYTIPMP